MSAPSHRVPAGRPVRWLLALVLALVAWPVASPSAHAASAGLKVTITAISTDGKDASSSVRVSGTVTNGSAVPAYGVQVAIVRNNDRLRTSALIRDAVAAERPPAVTEFRDSPTHTQQITLPTSVFAPGASATFAISGTLAELDLTPNSSYWAGARATGATRPGGEPDAALTGLGLGLATVPGDDAPSVVTIVELAATPSRLRTNLFLNERLASELAPDGRLRRLVDLARTLDCSWAVDPALVAEASDMADGYKVLSGDTIVDGTGAQAASEWLAAFRSLPAADGSLSLYGSPDIAGLLSAGVEGPLQSSLTATTASGLNLPVIATPRRVTPAVLADLGRRGVPVVSTGVPAGESWVSMGGARVAGAWDWDAVPVSPVLGDSHAARAAIALAETRASGRQVRLIRDPGDADSESAASPAWVVRTPLAVLTGMPPTSEADQINAPALPGSLTPALARRIDRLGRDMAAYASAAPKAGAAGLSDALTAAAASEAWLADPAARLTYLDQLGQRTGADAIRTGIAVSAAPTITMSSATNQFPATVTNRLADSITVRVVGVSDNSPRLSVQPSDWVTIRPNDSFTVQLTASAVANGVVGVKVHAETRDGIAVSSAVPVTIEATNLGQVGWIIIAISGAVLAVTTALRIRQVRRRMAGR